MQKSVMEIASQSLGDITLHMLQNCLVPRMQAVLEYYKKIVLMITITSHSIPAFMASKSTTYIRRALTKKPKWVVSVIKIFLDLRKVAEYPQNFQNHISKIVFKIV